MYVPEKGGKKKGAKLEEKKKEIFFEIFVIFLSKFKKSK
jgi:hypothetical protein